jgi:hypothetical protein
MISIKNMRKKLHLFLATIILLPFVINPAYGQYKGDWVFSVGAGYRTDESPAERPFIKPPDKLYDANDGTIKCWMGGFFTDISIQKAFFKKTLTGFTLRTSFHYIQDDFFVMPNYMLFHDWYYRQKGVDHRWLFGLQITNTKTRVLSSGEPVYPGGPILLPFDYRAWGLGARGGRLLSQKGMLKDTYLRGELNWVFARKYGYPPYHGIQFGLSVSKNLLLNN